MRIIKLLITLSFVMAITATATAEPSISVEMEQEEFEAGTEQTIAEFTVNNNDEENELLMEDASIDAPELITWDFTFTPSTAQILEEENQTVQLEAEIPENFQAGTYNAEAGFDFENEIDQVSIIDITVSESQNWTVSDTEMEQNLSVGSEGTLGQYELENTGNTEVQVQQEIEGNISEYVSVSDSVTLFPNIPETRTLTYDIPSDTDFGEYTGNLTIESEAEDQEHQINLGVDFLDDIDPVVHETNFSSFEATQPKMFEVEATDNLEVESVTADIEKDDAETNDTEITTLEFEKEEETNVWRQNMSETADTGEYSVSGMVEDTSGNNVTFEESFEINALNAFSPSSNIELDRFQSGTEVTKELDTFEPSTDLEVELSSFGGNYTDYQMAVEETPLNLSEDQDPEEETSRHFFDDVGDRITISEDSTVSIMAYSDEPNRYSGEISYTLPEYHETVENTQFSGEFTDFVTPQDTEFELSGVTYNCEGHPSDSAEESEWRCDFSVTAEQAGEVKQLEEAVDVVVPQEAQREQEEIWQSRIDDAQVRASTSALTRNMTLMGAGLMILVTIYITRYYPSHYSINRERSRSEKLGIRKILNRED